MSDKFSGYRAFRNFCNMYGSQLCKKAGACSGCEYVEEVQCSEELAKKSESGPASQLTKREHFAFEFAKLSVIDDLKSESTNLDCRRATAIYSVQQADELIKALNEEKEDGKL